jgi:hypothetical protein
MCDHAIVEAPAWRFCRLCGQVWDAEFPGVVYMSADDLASEIAMYYKSNELESTS